MTERIDPTSWNAALDRAIEIAKARKPYDQEYVRLLEDEKLAISDEA